MICDGSFHYLMGFIGMSFSEGSIYFDANFATFRFGIIKSLRHAVLEGLGGRSCLKA